MVSPRAREFKSLESFRIMLILGLLFAAPGIIGATTDRERDQLIGPVRKIHTEWALHQSRRVGSNTITYNVKGNLTTAVFYTDRGNLKLSEISLCVEGSCMSVKVGTVLRVWMFLQSASLVFPGESLLSSQKSIPELELMTIRELAGEAIGECQMAHHAMVELNHLTNAPPARRLFKIDLRIQAFKSFELIGRVLRKKHDGHMPPWWRGFSEALVVQDHEQGEQACLQAFAHFLDIDLQKLPPTKGKKPQR